MLFDPRKLTVAALLAAALGFVIQMTSGVTNTPTIPPGLVAMLVAAGLVALARASWMPLAGPVVGLLSLVIFVAIGAAERLFQPGATVAFTGAWLMVVALMVATIGGTFAAFRNVTREHGYRQVSVQRGCQDID
jgi:hypothetical protein